MAFEPFLTEWKKHNQNHQHLFARVAACRWKNPRILGQRPAERKAKNIAFFAMRTGALLNRISLLSKWWKNVPE